MNDQYWTELMMRQTQTEGDYVPVFYLRFDVIDVACVDDDDRNPDPVWELLEVCPSKASLDT